MLSQISFNIEAWSPEQVASWIKGLENNIGVYADNFEIGHINGWKLLNLCSSDFADLNIIKIGHQECILKAVKHLHNLLYYSSTENLSGRLLKLSTAAQQLISLFKGSNIIESSQHVSFPTDVLVAISNVLEQVKLTMSWLKSLNLSSNHHLSLYKVEISRIGLEIISLTKLSYSSNIKTTLHQLCQQIKSDSKTLQNNYFDSTIMLATPFEKISMNRNDDEELGLVIISENDMNTIDNVLEDSAADLCQKFDQFDQIIQINKQIVVAWSLDKLIALIQASGHEITFVIRKCARHKVTNNSLTLSQKHKVQACSAEDILNLIEPMKRLSSSNDNISEISSPSWAAQIINPVAPPVQILKDENDFNSRKYFSLGRRSKKGINTHYSLSPQNDSSISTDSLQFNKMQLRESNSLSKLLHPFASKKTISMERQASCKDLGGGDCAGYLRLRRDEGHLISSRWIKYWFILKKKDLYYYKSPENEIIQGSLHLPGYTVSPTNECKSQKFAFKVFNDKSVIYYLAAGKQSDMVKWMNMLGLASLKNLDTSTLENIAGFTPPSKDRVDHHQSESEEEMHNSSNTSNSDTLSLQHGESKDDLSGLYRRIRQADLHIDGTDRSARRTTLMNSMMGEHNRNNNNNSILINSNDNALLLKMLSLKRTYKDKEKQLELLNKLLSTEPVSSQSIQIFRQTYSNYELFPSRESLV